MKTFYTLSIFLFFIATGFAQNGINYKAQMNDANGDILANQPLELHFKIKDLNNTQYEEIHNTYTNENGLIQVIIGYGSPVIGIYDTLDWSLPDLSLEISADFYDGNGVVYISEAPFTAVPYAIEVLNPVLNKSGDDLYTVTAQIGIGTDDPQSQLHVNSSGDASILLTTDDINNSTSIRLENGLSTDSSFNYFKIENKGDKFILGKAGTFTGGAYVDALTINQNLGFEFIGTMKLNSGAVITEFSNIFVLENSNSTIPTQFAIETYVSDAIALASSKLVTLAPASFVGDDETRILKYSAGQLTYYEDDATPIYAPLNLPVGATIHQITYLLKDASSGSQQNLEGELVVRNMTNQNSSFLLSVSTSGATSGSQVEVATDQVGVVDNHTYTIHIRPQGTWDGNNLGVVGIKVFYTE